MVNFALSGSNSNWVASDAWAGITTFAITYYGNGAGSGTPPSDTRRYMEGLVVTVAGAGDLTKTGHTFGGWNTQPDGEGTSYTAADSFIMGTANVTLYARWTPLPTYSVTYHGNEATGGSVPVDSNNYLEGAQVPVLGNTGNLARTSYSFAGWNASADGSGMNYTAGATFNMGTSDIILYARWTEQPVYSVTCDSTGGNAVSSQDIEHGFTATEPTAPTKEGYSFAGWYRDASLSNTYDFSTPVTANIIVYARWTVNEIDECFIATAAYGSKLAPGVAILRQFRDAKLLTNLPGQALVTFYYQISPPIAEYIADNSLLKALIRTMLLPVITVAYLFMHLWLMLIAFSIAIMTAYYRRRLTYRRTVAVIADKADYR